MLIKGKIIKGEYFDSVSLMLVSKEINKMDGIDDSAVVMGTKENLSIVKVANLFLPEFENVKENDLLIVIKATDESKIEKAFAGVNDIFESLRKKSKQQTNFTPKSIDGAIKQLPDANLVLISIAGKYAAHEAKTALDNNLNVMLFSDNVSLEDEIALKKYALSKDLFVMGPDCGTAIINGTPLAFANVVNQGKIGIVGASGTGIQEVSAIISNLGGGISHAIGTGGRDVKKDVGGIMFLKALQTLNDDKNTEVIVLVSKPPHQEVLDKIFVELKNVKKPVVAIFIGAELENNGKVACHFAKTLEEAAYVAVAMEKKENINKTLEKINARNTELKNIAKNLAAKSKKKFVRGLFSGGTLCDETQLILKNYVGYVYSNTPLNKDYTLENSWISKENTIIDLGDDEFTQGRPHPMIDFSLRVKKLKEEAKNPEVAIILMDIVLGYGSNLHPDDELVETLAEIKKSSPDVVVIASITGTDKDPQNKAKVTARMKEAGVIIMESNAAASFLTGEILAIK